jgi:hypothetical protein
MMKKVRNSGPKYDFKTSLCIFFIADYSIFVCERFIRLTSKDNNFIVKNDRVSKNIIAGPDGASV